MNGFAEEDLTMGTFVLVHDAFQGGWVWGKVASLLRGQQHEAYAPTLTGCGERSHLLREQIGLHTYIQDIMSFLHFENLSDVILVSHGFAGMVTSAVIQAMPHVAKKVIYLDAIIPEQGKSFLDRVGDWFGYLLDSHTHNGWLVKPWPAISYEISPAIDKQWFESRLVNFPRAAFTTPFPGEFDSTLFDISFIHNKNDTDAMTRNAAHDARSRGWRCHELASGRLPMITTLEELTEMLMAVGS